MNHMDLSDELRRQLLESAAWGKAGVQPMLEEESVEDADDLLEEGAEMELEEGEEVDELHVCPLCTTMLDEAIDEEAILEHLDVVMTLVDRLSQINESEEDVDEVIQDTLAQALFGDEDDYDGIDEGYEEDED